MAPDAGNIQSCVARLLLPFLFVVVEKRVWLPYHSFLYCRIHGFCAVLIAEKEMLNKWRAPVMYRQLVQINK